MFWSQLIMICEYRAFLPFLNVIVWILEEVESIHIGK